VDCHVGQNGKNVGCPIQEWQNCRNPRKNRRLRAPGRNREAPLITFSCLSISTTLARLPQERPPALALNCRFELARRTGKSVGRRGRQEGDGVHHLANLQLNQRHGFRGGKNAKVINSSTLLLSR
jgi:hypothetical protein